MQVVAKKQKPSDSTPEPDSNRDGVNYNFWLSHDVAKALEAFRSEADVKPSKTRTISTALTEFLAKRGYWPYKDKSGEH